MDFSGDIDIDLANRDELLKHLEHRVASIHRKGKIEKHNTGVYFQDIPVNPFTGLSNIDHKEAAGSGFFKIDLLNVGVYEQIQSEQHLLSMMKEPYWELLDAEEVVSQLFHVGNYFWLIDKLKPRSIEQLAMILALIRPSKRHLQDCDWQTIEKEIWKKPEDGSYHFKRSHAISYATVVVVQLNLITEKMLNDT